MLPVHRCGMSLRFLLTKETLMDIHVGRCSNPQDVGYGGWIEPDDRSWIMFVDVEQKPVMFLNRDPGTGAVHDTGK